MKEEFSDFSTRADDRLSEDPIEGLMVKLIENISKSVDFEFSIKGNLNGLFSMPDLDRLNLLQKAQLARDLSELLYNIRNRKDSINIRESLGSLRNFKEVSQETHRDLITILKNSDATFLTKMETEEILNLIFSQCAESSSWVNQEELIQVQDEYIGVSKVFNAEVKKRKKKFQVLENQVLDCEKTEMQIGLLRTQEAFLEKQLEDIMIDQFIIEEQCKQLGFELNESEELLRELVQHNPCKAFVKEKS